MISATASVVKEAIQEIDPKAFITITQINEVRGRGFTMEKLRYDELNQNKNGNMG